MKWQMKVYHEVLKWIPGIFHIHKPIRRKTQQRGKSQILLCHGMSRTLPSQVHPCAGPRLLTGAQDQPRKVTNRPTFLRQKFTSLVPAIYSTSVFLPQVTYICLLFPLARAGVSLEPFYPICSHIGCIKLQTGDRDFREFATNCLQESGAWTRLFTIQNMLNIWKYKHKLMERAVLDSSTTSSGLRTWNPVLNYTKIEMRSESLVWKPSTKSFATALFALNFALADYEEPAVIE